MLNNGIYGYANASPIHLRSLSFAAPSAGVGVIAA